MKTVDRFLAFDLGAESGRAVVGTLAGGRLALEQAARFPNRPLRLRGSLHWNIFRLFEELRAVLMGAGPLSSLAVDSWGVDFVLLARDGSFLGLPFAYRDRRTDGAPDAFFRRVPAEEVYRRTGIQVLPFNTLYQLFAMTRDSSPLLGAAADLLMLPDALSWLLCGRKAAEFTIATTSQLYNPTLRNWDPELLKALGLSNSLFQEIVPPGTVLAPLESELAESTGLGPVPVVAVASHDTASAVAAVPAEEGDGWAFVSSGTWSLAGVENRAPVLTEMAMRRNFTNEGGAGGRFRFLKNVMGLWLLQECRRIWAARGEAWDYGALAAAAEQAPPFGAFLDPDWPGFLHPPDMPAAIAEYCRRTGQVQPAGPAAMARAILEGLALATRAVLEELQETLGRTLDRVHLVGGGSRNAALCAFTAGATGLPVLAGPAEAAAAGNIMVQAMALRRIGSLDDARRVARASFEPRRFEPSDQGAWADAWGRFRELRAGGRAG